MRGRLYSVDNVSEKNGWSLIRVVVHEFYCRLEFTDLIQKRCPVHLKSNQNNDGFMWVQKSAVTCTNQRGALYHVITPHSDNVLLFMFQLRFQSF